MAAVEIDEAELAALQRTARLVGGALNNPKAREQVLRGLKAANPDMPIPELDAAAPFQDALGEMNKNLAAMREEMAKDKEARENADRMARLQAQWNEGRQKAAKAGYVGDSLTALEKFMEEKGVADHEVAAAAFERLHPQPQPVANNSGKFDFFARKPEENDATQKMLWSGDSEGFLNNAVAETLNQIRGAA